MGNVDGSAIKITRGVEFVARLKWMEKIPEASPPSYFCQFNLQVSQRRFLCWSFFEASRTFNESVSIGEKQNTKISHNFYNRQKFISNDDDHADDDDADDDDVADADDVNDATDADDKTALKRKPKVDENRCWRRIVKMQNYFVVVFSIFDEFGQKKFNRPISCRGGSILTSCYPRKKSWLKRSY